MPVSSDIGILYAQAVSAAHARPSSHKASAGAAAPQRRTALGRGLQPRHPTARRRFPAILFAAALIVSATGCSAVAASPAPSVSGDLTVYHWWTAGGERDAMDKIELGFQATYNILIHDNPTAGGGGITLKTVMQGKLAANVPPDTFQSLAGGELKTYVDGGYLDNVDDIWTAQQLDLKYPPVLGQMVTFNGHKMAIPINIHRANWLFYNVAIFREYGLKPPRDVDELITDCQILSLRHIQPIGLGTRDKWTAVFLFDTVLLSVAGPQVYEKFYTGLLDPQTEPLIRKAFEKFRDLVSYIDPDHGSYSWSDMPTRLGSGQVAMMVLGDFAAPLLIKAGYAEGTDWEAAGFPQRPSETFLMVIDTFTRPKGIAHPDATTDWLDYIVSAKTQADFTVLKGSIAANQDVPISTYTNSLQQRASEAFRNPQIDKVPSSIHGALSPLPFLDAWQDLVTVFLYSPDVDRALSQTTMLMKSYDVAGNSAWYWAK
jgi:glucose/mannose transport system substrate-binding protein